MKEVGKLSELNLKAGETGTLAALNVQPGDVVEYVPTGRETTITHISGGKYYGSGDHPHLPYLEKADFRIVSRANSGPVRTVTRKEIVPGMYGRVEVTDSLHVRVNALNTATELRAAIATLTQIADALEESK